MVKTSLKEINVSKVINKPPSQYKHNSIDDGSKGKNKKFVEVDGEWGTFKDFPKVKKEYKSVKAEWKILGIFTEDVDRLKTEKDAYPAIVDTMMEPLKGGGYVVPEYTFFSVSVQLQPLAKDEEGSWLNFIIPSMSNMEAVGVVYDYFSNSGLTTRELNKAFKKVVTLDLGRSVGVKNFVENVYPNVLFSDGYIVQGRTASPVIPIADYRAPMAIELSNGGFGKPKGRKGKRREKHKFVTWKPKVFTNKDNRDVIFAVKPTSTEDLIKQGDVKIMGNITLKDSNKNHAQESWH